MITTIHCAQHQTSFLLRFFGIISFPGRLESFLDSSDGIPSHSVAQLTIDDLGKHGTQSVGLTWNGSSDLDGDFITISSHQEVDHWSRIQSISERLITSEVWSCLPEASGRQTIVVSASLAMKLSSGKGLWQTCTARAFAFFPSARKKIASIALVRHHTLDLPKCKRIWCGNGGCLKGSEANLPFRSASQASLPPTVLASHRSGGCSVSLTGDWTNKAIGHIGTKTLHMSCVHIWRKSLQISDHSARRIYAIFSISSRSH